MPSTCSNPRETRNRLTTNPELKLERFVGTSERHTSLLLGKRGERFLRKL